MFETNYHILPNGIRIIHRRSRSEVSWLGVVIGAGTRDEQDKENGLAHFIEHTVFKGTKRHSARQLISLIEGVGGELNAFTTKEETTYYATVRNTYFRRAASLIAEMVFNPKFPPHEVEKEKGVILDEIESYNDSPSELIYDDFENLIFSGHSLQAPILGTAKSLKKLSIAHAQQFMQRHYTTDNIVFFALSSLPFKRVVEIAQSLFSDFAPTTNTNGRVAPQQSLPLEVAYHKHTHQAHVMMGYRAFPLGHKYQPALYLINNIVGGGSMNSLLNLSLREAKGLVYTIESNYTPLSDTGYWSIYFASEPQHKDECIELVRKELNELRRSPMSSIAFHKSICQLKGQMAIAAESQENNALNLGKQFLYFNEAPTWQQQFERIEQLTPNDVFEVINILLNQPTYILQYS